MPSPHPFLRKKAFPALAEALWLTFLFLDLTGMADSTPVKFAAICLCALAAWTGARTPDGKLVAAALTLTVCADVFLLLLDRSTTDQIIGVTIFIVVQFLYAHRLYRLRGNRPCKWGLALRVTLSAFCFLAALGLFCGVWLVGSRDGQSFGPTDLVSSLPALPRLTLPLVYFSNLCINCAEAFALRANKPVSRFPWGLLLFIGCDICVGASNLGLLTSFTWWGSWLFYLPSQVLIVLSQSTKPEAQDAKTV